MPAPSCSCSCSAPSAAPSHTAAQLATGGDAVLIGASASVAALIGWSLRQIRDRHGFGELNQAVTIYGVFFIVFNLIGILAFNDSLVAYAAHAGGFMAGWVRRLGRERAPAAGSRLSRDRVSGMVRFADFSRSHLRWASPPSPPRLPPGRRVARCSSTASCSWTCSCSACSRTARRSSTPCPRPRRRRSSGATRRSGPARLRPRGLRRPELHRPAKRGRKVRVPGQDVCSHIEGLWPVLTRQPGEPSRPTPRSCRCPIPYVVPGGRFREIYYWDSYFTMLGLEQSGRGDLAARHGPELRLPDRPLRPRAERQPHLLSQPLAAAVLRRDGRPGRGAGATRAVRAEYLRQLRAGVRVLDGRRRRARAGQRAPARGAPARRHAAQPLLGRPRRPARRILPRGRGDRAATRPAAAEVYRDLRAAAESGWDFSSRWLADGRTLATIRTVGPRAGRSQQPAVPARETLAEAYRRRRRRTSRPQFETRAERARRPCAAICGTTSGACSPTTCGARTAQRTAHRGDAGSAVLRPRHRAAGEARGGGGREPGCCGRGSRRRPP